MLNLTKRQIIIILLIILVVIILGVNVYLFWGYQKKQAINKEQLKAIADTQQVRELISQEKWAELNADTLQQKGMAPQAQKIAADVLVVKKMLDEGKVNELDIVKLQAEGFAQEAIDYVIRAKDLAKQGVAVSEEEKIRADIIKIIKNEDNQYSQDSDIHQALLAQGEKAIPSLIILLESSDFIVKYRSYAALGSIIYFVKERPETAILAMEKGLSDQDFNIKYVAATYLTILGDKNGIPILIEALEHGEFIEYSRGEIMSSDALQTLKETTNHDFGDDIAKWQSWWNENKNNLRWDTKKGIFISA